MLTNIKDWDLETEARVDKAVAFFMRGYNCAQSVALAFADIYGISEPLMSRIASSFGGGIGRMRLTCGTANAIFLLAGLEVMDAFDSPYESMPEDYTPYPDIMVKQKDYEIVQQLAEEFKRVNGTIVCKELLGGAGCSGALAGGFVPEERNLEYYAKRPCARIVSSAVRIYMNYLRGKYAG